MSTLMDYLNPLSGLLDDEEEEEEEEETDSERSEEDAHENVQEAKYVATEEDEDSWDTMAVKEMESRRPVTSEKTAGSKHAASSIESTSKGHAPGVSSYRYKTSGAPIKPSPTPGASTSDSRTSGAPASDSRAPKVSTSDSHISDSPTSNFRISDAPTAEYRPSGSPTKHSEGTSQSRSGAIGLVDTKSAFSVKTTPSGHLKPPNATRKPLRQSKSASRKTSGARSDVETRKTSTQATGSRNASVAEVKAALRTSAKMEARRINNSNAAYNMPSHAPIVHELRPPHRAAWQRIGMQPKSHDVRPRGADGANAHMVGMSGMVNQVVDVVCKEDLRNIISHYVNEQVGDADPLGVGRLALALRRCHEARDTNELARKPLRGADLNTKPGGRDSINSVQLMEAAKERIELLSQQVDECGKREGLVRRNLENTQNELLLLQRTVHGGHDTVHSTKNTSTSTSTRSSGERARGRSLDSPSHPSAREKDRPNSDEAPGVNEKTEDKMSPQRKRKHKSASTSSGEPDITTHEARGTNASPQLSYTTGSPKMNGTSQASASALRTPVLSPRGYDAPRVPADEDHDSLENFETAVGTMKDRLYELTKLVNLTLDAEPRANLESEAPNSGKKNPTSDMKEELEVCKRSLKLVLDAHMNSIDVVDAMKNKLRRTYIKGGAFENVQENTQRYPVDQARTMRSSSPDGINAKAFYANNVVPSLHSPRLPDNFTARKAPQVAARARSLSPADVANTSMDPPPHFPAHATWAHFSPARPHSSPPPPIRHGYSAAPALCSHAKASPRAASSLDVPHRPVSCALAPARDISPSPSCDAASTPNPPANRAFSPLQRLPCLASLRRPSPSGVVAFAAPPDISGARGASSNSHQASHDAFSGHPVAPTSCMPHVAFNCESSNLYIPPRKKCMGENARPDICGKVPVRQESQVRTPSVGAIYQQSGLHSPSPRGGRSGGGGGDVAGVRGGTSGLSSTSPGVSGGTDRFTPDFSGDVSFRAGRNGFSSSGIFDLHYAPLEPPPRGAYKPPTTLDAPRLLQTSRAMPAPTATRVVCETGTLKDSSLARSSSDDRTGQRYEQPRPPTSRTPPDLRGKLRQLPKAISPRVTDEKQRPSAVDHRTLRVGFNDSGLPCMQLSMTAKSTSRLSQKQATSPTFAAVTLDTGNARSNKMRSESPKDIKHAILNRGGTEGGRREETVKCGTLLAGLRPCEKIAGACTVYGSKGAVVRGTRGAEKELREEVQLNSPVLSRTPSPRKIPKLGHTTQVSGMSESHAKPYAQFAVFGEGENKEGAVEAHLTPDFSELQRRRGLQRNVRTMEAADRLVSSPHPADRPSTSRLDNTRLSHRATAPHLVVAKRPHDEQRLRSHAVSRSDHDASRHNYNALHGYPPVLVSVVPYASEYDADSRGATAFLGQPAEVETKSRIKRHEFPLAHNVPDQAHTSVEVEGGKRVARRTLEVASAVADAPHSRLFSGSPSAPIAGTVNDGATITNTVPISGHSQQTAILEPAVLSGKSTVSLSDQSYVNENSSQSRGPGVIILPDFESRDVDFDSANWTTGSTMKQSSARYTASTLRTVPVSSFRPGVFVQPPASDLDADVMDITPGTPTQPIPRTSATPSSVSYQPTGIETSHNVVSSGNSTHDYISAMQFAIDVSRMAAAAAVGTPTLLVVPPSRQYPASSVDPGTYPSSSLPGTLRLVPAKTSEYPHSAERHLIRTPGAAPPAPTMPPVTHVFPHSAPYRVQIPDTSEVPQEHTVEMQWLKPGSLGGNTTHIDAGGVAPPDMRVREAREDGTREPMEAYHEASYNVRPQDRWPPGIYNALAQLGILNVMGTHAQGAPVDFLRDRELLVGPYGPFAQSGSTHTGGPVSGLRRNERSAEEIYNVDMQGGSLRMHHPMQDGSLAAEVYAQQVRTNALDEGRPTVGTYGHVMHSAPTHDSRFSEAHHAAQHAGQARAGPGLSEIHQATPDHLEVAIAGGRYAEESQYAPPQVDISTANRHTFASGGTLAHGMSSAATAYDTPGAPPLEEYGVLGHDRPSADTSVAEAQCNQHVRHPSSGSRTVKSSSDMQRSPVSFSKGSPALNVDSTSCDSYRVNAYQIPSQLPVEAPIRVFESVGGSLHDGSPSVGTVASDVRPASLHGERLSDNSFSLEKRSTAQSVGRATRETYNEPAQNVRLTGGRPPAEPRVPEAQSQGGWSPTEDHGTGVQESFPVQYEGQQLDTFGEGAHRISLAPSVEPPVEMSADAHHVVQHSKGHAGDVRAEEGRYTMPFKDWPLAGAHLQEPPGRSPSGLRAPVPNISTSMRDGAVSRDDVAMDPKRARAVTFGGEVRCGNDMPDTNRGRGTRAVTFGGEVTGNLLATAPRVLPAGRTPAGAFGGGAPQAHPSTASSVEMYPHPREKPSAEIQPQPVDALGSTLDGGYSVAASGATLDLHTPFSTNDGWTYAHSMEETSRVERTSHPSETHAAPQDTRSTGGAGDGLVIGAMEGTNGNLQKISETYSAVVRGESLGQQVAVEKARSGESAHGASVKNLHASGNQHRGSIQSTNSSEGSTKLRIGRPSTDEGSFGGSSSQSDFLTGDGLAPRWDDAMYEVGVNGE
eukprot:GEMP01000176.1.p1 GENE.GEMP01000176.1~~GEMP01000176.1.p1  ORF type:complete len:2589 (+),score=508.58 GEMP01000176.1:337-8103(+)